MAVAYVSMVRARINKQLDNQLPDNNQPRLFNKQLSRRLYMASLLPEGIKVVQDRMQEQFTRAQCEGIIPLKHRVQRVVSILALNRPNKESFQQTWSTVSRKNCWRHGKPT